MSRFAIKLRTHQLKAIVSIIIGWILAKCIQKEKDLWLLCERGTDAQDNGFWMFQYIKEKHPEINAKYLISSTSSDKERLCKWKDDLVEYGSIKHSLLIWQAEYIICTHIYGYFPKSIRHQRRLRHFFEKKGKAFIIWLQHGIIKNDHPSCHYGKVSMDIFICGALPEYNFIHSTFGHPEGVVQYTGLARFDGLHNVKTNKQQILIMPTWRAWLKKGGVEGSEFLETYKALLLNERLHQILEENQLQVVFYPHYELQPYISEFSKADLPANIIIADKEHFNVQQLLKESALLITDYSSVFFDFAYMKKPILYFQFDEKRFEESHYAKGYYDYHDGLGEWTDNINDLLASLEKLIEGGLDMPQKYLDKVDEFFPLYDTNNCERIFNAIKALRN